MTKRNTQFTASNLPTMPTKLEFTPQQEEQPNPLAAFFRKSKLSISLPSRGKWYPKDSLLLDSFGKLPIFAMNASDDIKFRTGDATLTGKNIYEIIHSCAPGILEPENIPYIDVDTILLAIRLASYGDDFNFTVSVPNTKLTRNIKITAKKMLAEISARQEFWDEKAIITDETGQRLELIIQPISLSKVFSASKTMYMQQRAMAKNIDNNDTIKNDELFSSSVETIANNAIDLFCAGISELKIIDNNNHILITLDTENPADSSQILQVMHSLDVEYFNAVRDHIDLQRQKYVIMSPTQESTETEIRAGAPKEWTVELSFMSSNFLPDQKNAFKPV